jgi:hypothetical protein
MGSVRDLTSHLLTLSQGQLARRSLMRANWPLFHTPVDALHALGLHFRLRQTVGAKPPIGRRHIPTFFLERSLARGASGRGGYHRVSRWGERVRTKLRARGEGGERRCAPAVRGLCFAGRRRRDARYGAFAASGSSRPFGQEARDAPQGLTPLRSVGFAPICQRHHPWRDAMERL